MLLLNPLLQPSGHKMSLGRSRVVYVPFTFLLLRPLGTSGNVFLSTGPDVKTCEVLVCLALLPYLLCYIHIINNISILANSFVFLRKYL